MQTRPSKRASDAILANTGPRASARGLPVPPGRVLPALVLGAWVSATGAAAEQPVGCADLTLGRFDMALAADAGTVRAVEMNAGDRLAFTFRSDLRATGAIRLVAADGREHRLVYGPHAKQVSYTATASGPIRFRVDLPGGKIEAFVTSCTPARASATPAPDDITIDTSLLPVAGGTPSKEITTTGMVSHAGSGLWWVGEQTGESANKFGFNLKLQPALTVGLLGQFDQASDPLLGPSALSEQHWLAGPALSVLLGAGLSLDARAAWSPADPITGQALNQTFDARLTGRQETGPWRFSPTISYAHSQTRLDAASGSGDGRQTVESGRFEVRPEMAYRIDLGGAMYIEPKVMMGTTLNLGDTMGPGTAAEHALRRMAETAITLGTPDGTQLQVGAAVQDGETRSDPVWTGRMQLNLPLR